MTKNKRYYWLKLNENFFEDDTIRWLEEQDNGKDYVIFYLKLCLKSLSDDGKLIRYVGERLIPYDVKALGRLTNTSPDTVAVAMKSFLEIGLVERLETGEIYMTQINEMIGSETDSARRMRKKRLLDSRKQELLDSPSQSDNVVQKSDTEIEIETELDIEIDKEIDKEAGSEKTGVVVVDYKMVNNFYQNNFGILTPFLAENLKMWCEDIGPEMVLEAMKIANKSQKPFTYAEGIMKNWERNNIKTIEDVEANEIARSKQKRSYQRPVTPKETLPDWAQKDYKPPHEEPATKESETVANSIDWEERRKRLEKIVAQRESENANDNF